MYRMFNTDMRGSGTDARGFVSKDICVYPHAIRGYSRSIRIFSYVILIFSILVLTSDPLHASTAADVKKGNLLYNDKKYDERTRDKI